MEVLRDGIADFQVLEKVQLVEERLYFLRIHRNLVEMQSRQLGQLEERGGPQMGPVGDGDMFQVRQI